MMINATCARTPRHPLHVKEKAKLIGYNAQNASTGSTCKYLHCNISKQRKRIEKLESFCDIFSPNSERFEHFQKIGNHIFKILTEA